MWWLLREIDVPARRWWREVALPVYPLLAVPAVLSAAALKTPLADSLLGLGVAGVASVSAYYLGVFAVGLDATERGEVRSVVGSIRARLKPAR